MSTASKRLRSERGSVLIAGLLLSLALMMLLGAAVDIGHAFIVRRDLTAQADDAALAGSQALDLDALHRPGSGRCGAIWGPRLHSELVLTCHHPACL